MMRSTGHFLGECMGQNGGYPCAKCGPVITAARRELALMVKRELAGRPDSPDRDNVSPQDTETTP